MPEYRTRKKRDAPVRRSKVETQVDDLLAFERFRTEIAPELREMLLNGATTKQILKRFENYAAAKILTIALTEPDSSKALAAAKDILDRSHGKATETKKIEHTLASADEKEIDALIESELSDAVIIAEYSKTETDETDQ